MKEKKVLIIDTDPGIDDALALKVLAKHKDLFDIKLFMSTAGNTPIDITTKNLQFFVNKYFNGVKLAKGLGKPVIGKGKLDASDVHGVGGLGNFSIGEQDYPVENDFVTEMKSVILNSKSKVTIITLGPLTNIAKLFLDCPQVISNIDEIHSMIGSIEGVGNIKPYAEFNAYVDPKALDIVVSSGVKIVFNPFEIGNITKVKKVDMLKSIIDGCFEFRDPSKVSLFDVHTVMELIYPELYEFNKCDVKVYNDNFHAGKTVMTKNPKGNCLYIMPKDLVSINDFIVKELFE